jgi:hypothetical protein
MTVSVLACHRRCAALALLPWRCDNAMALCGFGTVGMALCGFGTVGMALYALALLASNRVLVLARRRCCVL